MPDAASVEKLGRFHARRDQLSEPIVRPFGMPRRVLYGGTVMKADPETFVHIGGGFARDRTAVWFAGDEVSGLDPATTFALSCDYASDGKRVVLRTSTVDVHAPSFEVLGMVEHIPIARDRDHVYGHDEPIAGLDVRTFELLGSGLAADRTGLWQVRSGKATRLDGDRATVLILDEHYACDRERAWHRGERIEGVDVAAFRSLGWEYATDGTRVYCRGRVVEPTPTAVLEGGYTITNARVAFHAVVEQADAATFRSLGHLFARDARRVYFDGVVVDDADPDTFAVLVMGEGNGWVRDRERVWFREYQWNDYCDGYVLRLVDGIAPATFEVIDDAFGRDAEHVWRGTGILDGADAASFRSLGGAWYRDRAALWMGSLRLGGANPESLAIHGGYAIIELADVEIQALGDGFARNGDSVMFAGQTLEGPGTGARSLGGGYLVDGDAAWHFELVTESRKMPEFVAAGGRLEGADPATLRRDRGFAIDRANVFAGSSRLEGANAAAFRALDAHHGTDGQLAYFDSIRIDCDVAKLRSLGGHYASRGYTLATTHDLVDAWSTDGTTLFVNGHPVWDRKARYLGEENEALLRRLDVVQFAILDPWWGTDGQVVVALRDGAVEVAAHTPSFEVLGHGYGRDVSRVWSAGGSLRDADAATFRVLGDGYAMDGTRAWHRGEPIRDIDGPLRVLGGGWARDGAGILCGARRVDADPESFVVVGSPVASEADWDLGRLELELELELDERLWLGERVAVGRDRDRYWWGWHSSTPATAVAVGHGYLIDDREVWHTGTKIAADGTTFVAIGGGYARDAYRAYFHARATR